MNKVPDLKQLMEDLLSVKSRIESLDKDMELMRNYYKHQSTDCDVISEEAAISYQYMKEINTVIGLIEELKNHEESAGDE